MKMATKIPLIVGRECYVTTRKTPGVCRVMVERKGALVCELKALCCFENAGERGGFCCGITMPFLISDVTVIEMVTAQGTGEG
jgi:hypothetical protein